MVAMWSTHSQEVALSSPVSNRDKQTNHTNKSINSLSKGKGKRPSFLDKHSRTPVYYPVSYGAQVSLRKLLALVTMEHHSEANTANRDKLFQLSTFTMSEPCL